MERGYDMTKPRAPRAVVLMAPGTNRHRDMAFAWELAGADVDVVDVVDLPTESDRLERAQVIAVAGGFSYADALGSGRVFADQLVHRVGDLLTQRIAAGTPVIGVCNGFQVLVRTGLLPGVGAASLAENSHGRFECRWVHLAPVSTHCIWTHDLPSIVTMPVAHGEGRFLTDALDTLVANDQVAFRYVTADGAPAHGVHPHNPNGSVGDIAGVCDTTGLVLGMMPHPENHVTARQGRSGSTCGEAGLALSLFRNGVEHVR